METFTRHIFVTLTYARVDSIQDTWKIISKDFNRFHQRFKRLHNCEVQYLRVVEEHKDGYPHLHAVMQFPDARIRVTNSRYFDRLLFQKWKTLWLRGHSDFQQPKKSGIGTISYVMKYLIKNQTSKTVWNKIYVNVIVTDTQKNMESSSVQDVNGNIIPVLESENKTKTPRLPTHLEGVKLCSWSRNFDFTPFVPK